MNARILLFPNAAGTVSGTTPLSHLVRNPTPPPSMFNGWGPRLR